MIKRGAVVAVLLFLVLALAATIYALVAAEPHESASLGVITWLFVLGYPTSTLLEPWLAPLGILGYLTMGALQFALLGACIGLVLQRFKDRSLLSESIPRHGPPNKR